MKSDRGNSFDRFFDLIHTYLSIPIIKGEMKRVAGFSLGGNAPRMNACVMVGTALHYGMELGIVRA
ncbi:MAG: hypothetical protein JKY48_06410 [Flavobacteriales bacterium]|nr:hypothetical protein [Flavobacteriales bacterium]